MAEAQVDLMPEPQVALAETQAQQVTAPEPAPPAALESQARPSQMSAPADQSKSFREMHADLVKALYASKPQTVNKAFEMFEQKTGGKREYLLYAGAALFSLYMIVGSAARLICSLVGFGYPAYASVKAIRTEDKTDDTLWLTYWATFGAFSLLDSFSDPIMGVLPLYWLAKTAFLLYLSLPQTRGAQVLYATVDAVVTRLDGFINSRSAAKTE